MSTGWLREKGEGRPASDRPRLNPEKYNSAYPHEECSTDVRKCQGEAILWRLIIKTDRSEAFTVTILFEKHICKSCEFVVEQFKSRYPNATVRIVSGNQNYGDVNAKGERGLKNWKYRKG